MGFLCGLKGDDGFLRIGQKKGEGLRDKKMMMMDGGGRGERNTKKVSKNRTQNKNKHRLSAP